jgi:tripartite-type tricarboxylate transporter receptor subunit TctC
MTCLAAVTAILAAQPAVAQDFPAKPVRIIAASAPGGISDVFMRAVGDELHKRWGQPVIIENRSGGNFNIGSRACAEAEPDGYTFCLISNAGVTYNLYLYRHLPFDLETGKPKTLSFSSAGEPLILFIDNLNKKHGIDIIRVPFKGGGDAINGVLTGVTPITFIGVGNMISHVQAGRINAILFDGHSRAPLFPDVPTFADIGYDGPLTRSYFGLYAPRGTPKAMMNKVAADIRAIAGEPSFADRNLIQRGLEPVLSTPDQFAEFFKKDRAASKRVVDEAKIPMRN